MWNNFCFFFCLRNTFKIFLMLILSNFIFLHVWKWIQTLRKLANDIQSQKFNNRFPQQNQHKSEENRKYQKFLSLSRGRKVTRKIKRCFRRFECLSSKYLQSSANTCETNFPSCSKKIFQNFSTYFQNRLQQTSSIVKLISKWFWKATSAVWIITSVAFNLAAGVEKNFRGRLVNDWWKVQ